MCWYDCSKNQILAFIIVIHVFHDGQIARLNVCVSFVMWNFICIVSFNDFFSVSYSILKKVHVGNGKEKGQSERKPTPKTDVGKT